MPAYAFILLPVAALVLFSFQDGRLPVPPFEGDPALVRGPRRRRADGRARQLGAGGARLLGPRLRAWLPRGLRPRPACPAGAGFLRGLIALPLAVCTSSSGWGCWSFNPLGLPRSLWAVGVGHVVINLPLCFAILYAAMGPQTNAERAARDLGASEARVILLVTLPMLRPRSSPPSSSRSRSAGTSSSSPSSSPAST